MTIGQKPVESKKFISAQTKKRSSDVGSHFTPFDDPQKVLQLTTAQINSPEWYVTTSVVKNTSEMCFSIVFKYNI